MGIRDTSTRAVVYLRNDEAHAAALKRLALFFDEILYILPEIYALDEKMLRDGKHFEERRPGVFVVKDFNYFRDV